MRLGDSRVIILRVEIKLVLNLSSGSEPLLTCSTISNKSSDYNVLVSFII